MKVAIIGAAMAVGVVFSAKTWHTILEWAVTHKLIAPAAENPMVRMPGGGGEGLDLGRIVVILSLLGLLTVAGISTLRARSERRRRELM